MKIPEKFLKNIPQSETQPGDPSGDRDGDYSPIPIIPIPIDVR